MHSVELLDVMGSDLSVVNAARVSFNKRVEGTLEDKDKRLIRYLATHNHWTPFAHVQLSFRVSTTIAVARQLAKHQVGLVWNEVSRRYVDDEPEFDYPEVFRQKADNVKQGSNDYPVDHNELANEIYEASLYTARMTYNDLLSIGVCPEQARMVLPLATMTEWVWTGSLVAFARVLNLRLAKDTQKETREVAESMYKILYKCDELRYSLDSLVDKGLYYDAE